jgi:hypothetical protein
VRFEIAEHQINCFNEFGFIEFENVIPLSVIDKWNKPSCRGPNLRKTDPLIHEILIKPFFPKMAASLLRKQQVRLLFDQVVTSSKENSKFFNEPHTLQEISCFQDVEIGAIFPVFLTTDKLPANPFPQNLQNILFIRSDYPLNWKELFSPHRYVLLTFGSQRSVYIYNQNDPHTHSLKKFGYGFGDNLKQEDCPLFRFSLKN